MKYLSSDVFLSAVIFSLALSAVTATVRLPRRTLQRAEQAFRELVCTASLVRNLAALAETSPAVVNALRAEPRSLASVAANLGVDPDAVVALARLRLIDRLELMVARGQCSEAKADRLVSRSASRLQKLMMVVSAEPVSVPSTAVTAQARAQGT